MGNYTIPSIVMLRNEAKHAWEGIPNSPPTTFMGTPMTGREATFRRQFVEAIWAPRINAARHAGDIDDEQLRLAFDAVLSPIPYRRRFGRLVKMLPHEALTELIDCGEDIKGLTDDELMALAREYGILIVGAFEVIT